MSHHVPPARFARDPHGGMEPGPGWFALPFGDASFRGIPGHAYTALDRRARWQRYGFALDVLSPGVANGKYHSETYADESFVVIDGDVDAIVEGRVVEMTAGDMLHCPAGTAHILAGAGDAHSIVAMLGTRGVDPPGADWGVYVPDPVAARYGASVAERTPDPRVAYADRPEYAPVPRPRRWGCGGGGRPGAREPAGTATFTQRDDGRLVRTGDGWFVLSVDRMAWSDNGRVCRVRTDDDVRFTQYGVNVRTLRPGWPSSMYHREFDDDETMVVLDGACVAVVEGSAIALDAGTMLHLPAGTAHVTVGAGTVPCTVLMVGSRRAAGTDAWGEYVPDPEAARLGAAVAERTTDPRVAYADEPPFSPSAPLWTFRA
ncbi:MAG: cupin domain-containing protein [Thermoleophilia bacterium]|nr:cupin domain-containing protein [Thermoleophilia bacterium]